MNSNYSITKHNPIYLLDQCVASYFGTKPEHLFLDVVDVLPIDSTDDEILDYSINNDKIIVTKDYNFALKILLQLRDVVFQSRDNKRFYFKPTKSHLLTADKTNAIKKILDTISIKNKISYIADTDYLSLKLKDYDIHSPITKLSNLNSVSSDTRLKLILQYARKTKSTLVSSSNYNCIRSLFELEECVFVDDILNLNYLSVKYYEFDTVRFDKGRLGVKNSCKKHNDILQENIRLAREDIDKVCRNLNFIESELLRRRELEALNHLEPPQVPHIPTKGNDTLE